MALLRKRPPDPEAERVRHAFGVVATAIDAAQRALLAAIPTSRDPGVPLGQALSSFGVHLGRAADAMKTWRSDRTAEHWDRCQTGLESARAAAERLRLEPGSPGFEALNARVGEILHHLEEFADAERELRRL